MKTMFRPILVRIDAAHRRIGQALADPMIKRMVNSVDAQHACLVAGQPAKADTGSEQPESLPAGMSMDDRPQFRRVGPPLQLDGERARQKPAQQSAAEVEAGPILREEAGPAQGQRGVAGIGVAGGMGEQDHGE